MLSIVPDTRHKPIKAYAVDIYRDWAKVYFGAKPYLEAMLDLDQIEDMYICDSGTSIVTYFLANAQTWRGDTAKRIKKELKEIVDGCDARLAQKKAHTFYNVKPR